MLIAHDLLLVLMPGAGDSSRVSLLKGALIPIMRAPASCSNLTPITHKGSIYKYHHIAGLGLRHTNFGGGTNIKSKTVRYFKNTGLDNSFYEASSKIPMLSGK